MSDAGRGVPEPREVEAYGLLDLGVAAGGEALQL